MPDVKPTLANQHNQQLAKILPSPIRVIDAEFSKVPGLIKLTLGEPDFAVPEHIKAAAKQAIDDDDSHYAKPNGHAELRQTISQYLSQRFDTPVYDPDTEVTVTMGASEALYATMAGLFNPGDEIIIPTPSFPMYEAIAEILDLQVVELNTAPDFRLTPEKLEPVLTAHPNAKGILINYPSNPTGVAYNEQEVAALADTLRQHDLIVISDEIYAELVFDAKHTSLAKLLPEQTILVSGLSKSHAMTGYRMGYVAGPAELMQHVTKMHQFLVTTAPGPMMAAANEALKNGLDDAKTMRDAYRERRDLVLEGMQAAGFEVIRPSGAFYLFAKIPDELGMDDMTFIRDLAQEALVGVAPGSIFGAGGEGHIRLSYAASTEELTEAMKRIQTYMQQKLN
ncbi:aminotransferase [Weissella uvarum]|uniref:aminotransferase class I/II-fold pyridoxal phosphate-dependent enzyme n=1 Tax=Weissella uvarum TaxID=1479233 RepID=UPI0019607BB2|nr:aminotransferase class I/II-fold pyridoxal phosphate-dependent enzyme [Weissella uvarum]MBM7617176.1 aminotransferase [Weissella uvarum]MCM0595472.1 aminotransferase class I/II-fold pyridoxal phosphate-dependent enzyme [Weissella uvarum]